MPAMADLLLRRAPAAPGEVYNVLSGSRIVGRPGPYPTTTTKTARLVACEQSVPLMPAAFETLLWPLAALGLGLAARGVWAALVEG